MSTLDDKNVQGRSRRKPDRVVSGDATGLERRKKPARKGKKIRRIIIMSVLEVFVLFGIFSYAYVLKQYNKIQRPDFEAEEVKNEDLSVETQQKLEGYWNIAVFGIDSRSSKAVEGNSDVIMIASINKDTGEIRLVSVFRDTYLKVSDNSYNKINSAYAVGGPQQAVKALNQNLDLDITDYVTFNWKAVATGINILGGVDIELSKAELHYINSYITETVKSTGIGSVQIKGTGMHHLDGVQAVAYARLRYMDNDFARTERQRKVVTQAFEKAKKTDLNTLNGLLGNMLAMVATNLTWQDGLDAIANVNKYHLGENGGFPFARGDANMGKKGACVIPQTLESNVKELHKFLFDDETYEVSATVKQISNKISSDSGMYNEGKYVGHVSTDGGYIGYTGESSKKTEETKESGTPSNSSKKTSTSESKKLNKDDMLAETDANGNITYLYETNAAGRIIGIYELDEDGNLVVLERDEEESATDAQGNVITETSATRAADEESTSSSGNGPGERETAQVKPGTSHASTEATTQAHTSSTQSSQGTVTPTAPTTTQASTTSAGPGGSSSSSSSGPGSGSIETVPAKPE